MAGFGKWIGGGFGWAFAGPIGGILGFAIGSMFDNAGTEEYKRIYRSPEGGSRTQSGDFSASLLVLSAAVMKADGKVLKSELDFVKHFFIQQFGVEKTRQQMQIFKEVLKKDIPLQEVCIQIRHFTSQADRLHLLHFLFGIAGVDRQFEKSEISVIQEIATLLGISTGDYGSIKAMFTKDSESDYNILEITREASDEEIKKAYRKMALKYHPDKVGHLGEEFQQMAKEKFQKVQMAYESIKKVRGLS